MNKLKVIDLFSGAGGMSKGFLDVGYEIECAVEVDSWASETYEANHPDINLIIDDIRNIPNSFFKKYKKIDLVMGGPPCQGFSISASNRRKSDDPRNYLYLEFLRAVSIIKPRAVLIENVREVQKFKLPDGRLLCDDIKERLLMLGYESEMMILNSSDFGVPQVRLRNFIFAFQKNIEFRKKLEKLKIKINESPNTKISLWEAISDLPNVIPSTLSENAISKYAHKPQNQYQKKIRKKSYVVTNHVPMRHTPRMIERFKHLIENESNSSLPRELSPRLRGNVEVVSEKKYDQNHRILDPLKPSPTITASFYSSFIHPYQPRNLTVREAARLQSFPDTFIFKGKRTTLSKKLLAKKGIIEDLHLDQFNQVGNSVPPLLAQYLAKTIKSILTYGN
jgi:DNA (cytosine-5)-methyltransferase 1